MNPTPETDAMVAADQHHLEDDSFFPATVYWRMVALTRTLERDRDEWVAKAVELCAERESNAMQALAYKAERDEARESLAATEAWSALLAEVGDNFRAENAELRAAIRNLRDVKGRYHTQIATEQLFALLPENADVEASAPLTAPKP
jgi:hypothetical protein